MNQHGDFKRLVNRYADGDVSASDMEALNERLREDAAARDAFIDLMNLDSALADLTADGTPAIPQHGLVPDEIRPSADPTKQPYAHQRTTALKWMVLAAACLSLVACLWPLWQQTSAPFAVVQRAAGVDELADTTKLNREVHSIQAGTLELMTIRGVRVVIEAPAEFQFESPQRLHLKRGRMTADVPPKARGFTVITPNGEAVDLGTKFGVDVPREGHSEIHVFQGEVVAQSTGGGKKHSLTDGEACQLHSGPGGSGLFRSAAFIRPDEVAALHAALAAGQQQTSRRAASQLKQDPALIAFLDFESDVLPEGRYRMVQGRWPGSRAPEFVNVGDHMTVNAGGDHDWPQLTLAAWVRIDRLNAPYQSLLHTDGWSIENQGQVHWMINRNTTMRLALFGNTLAPGSSERDGYPDSSQPVLPEQGRWVHLAAVYDSNERSVRFYLNGQFDKVTRLDIAFPARLGPAQIGNWERHDRKLSGRIDELVILGRSMSDNEVNMLFESGNPYR